MAVSNSAIELKANGRRSKVEMYPGNSAWQFSLLTSNLILTTASRIFVPETKVTTKVHNKGGSRRVNTELPWSHSTLKIVTDISNVSQPKYERVSIKDVFSGLPLLADEIQNRYEGQAFFPERNGVVTGIVEHAFHRLNFIPENLLKHIGPKVNLLAQIASPNRVGEYRNDYSPEARKRMIKNALGGLAWGVKNGNERVLDLLGVDQAISGWHYQQDIQYEITHLYEQILLDHKVQFLKDVGPIM